METRKPRRMNPSRWKAMYDKKEGAKIPLGIKRFSIFYKLEYYENLPIAHLFDTMHIGKMWQSAYGNI